MMTFSNLDIIAFGWFLVCWLGYAYIADYSRFRQNSIRFLFYNYRLQWMQILMRRDYRIVDTTIQGMLSRGVSFFASTSMFVIGGLIGLLGAADKALTVLNDIPMVSSSTAREFELKLLLLITIFIFTFFKLVWSYRLFNYCAILMGAAPQPNETTPEKAARFAKTITGVHFQGSHHFNAGMRGYFFGLAVLGWFLNPYIFMATSTLVVIVMIRRDYFSISHALIKTSGDLDIQAEEK